MIQSIPETPERRYIPFSQYNPHEFYSMRMAIHWEIDELRQCIKYWTQKRNYPVVRVLRKLLAVREFMLHA